MDRPIPKDAAVSARMSRQKQKNTRPEQAVRRIVHALGHRYRVHSRRLPGSPDLSNLARRWAVFVHGCYWHQHPGCRHATMPTNNRAWWQEKFDRNRARDARTTAELQSAGLRVLVVWECECRDEAALRARITEFLAADGASG